MRIATDDGRCGIGMRKRRDMVLLKVSQELGVCRKVWLLELMELWSRR